MSIQLPKSRLAAGLLAGLLVGLAVASAGCARSAGAPAPSLHMVMPGDDPMPPGDGLSDSMTGYTFVPASTSLSASSPNMFTFRITGPDGRTVTVFQPEQTKMLHFYLIRSDLTGFAHLHPTMANDGTWSVPIAALAPGDYRAYVSFTTSDPAGKPLPFVLSTRVTVPGRADLSPLPPASDTATVDGYTLRLSGQLMTGMGSFTLDVSKDGQPVTDLQPYLDSYAHLTGFHSPDLAFAHLHPQGSADGEHGGPRLAFDADFPRSGLWRLFVQFQTGGVVHTAVFTVDVEQMS